MELNRKRSLTGEGLIAILDIVAAAYQPRHPALSFELVRSHGFRIDVQRRLHVRVPKQFLNQFPIIPIRDPSRFRNVIALLGMMWNQAKACGYVQHDPFLAIVLPERDPLNEPCLTLKEMKAVIVAVNEPYKTYYWILAETGVRACEIGALPVSNLLLNEGAIRIAQSVWHGKIHAFRHGNATVMDLRWLRVRTR